MAIVLRYKISTTVGVVILMTLTIFCIVTITDRAFSNSYDFVATAQMSQLDLIRRTIGADMDKNNTANWNVYTNANYGFSIQYPETLAQIEDENLSMYSEDYSSSPIRPLKITFENFVVKVWDDPNSTELKKYFARTEICVLEEELCRSYKKIDEISLIETILDDNEWFQTASKPQRYFIASLDNKYFLDFELTNSKQSKEFNKIISTVEFIR